MNNNKLLWLVLHTMTGLIFLGLVYLLFFEERLFEHMANYLCLSLCLAIIQLLFLYVLGVLAIKKLKPETRRQRLLLLATIVCGLAFQAATDIFMVLMCISTIWDENYFFYLNWRMATLLVSILSVALMPYEVMMAKPKKKLPD